MTIEEQLSALPDGVRALETYKATLLAQGRKAANRFASRFFYDPMQHTHVLVKHPDANDPKSIAWDAWRSPFDIVLHTGPRVWVSGCYMHSGHKDVLQVGDGTSKGYNEHGECILSVPAEWCRYYTPEDAKGIERCLDADDRLLRYAL